MSLLRSVEGTAYHATVSNASRPVLTFLSPALPPVSTRRSFHQGTASSAVINRPPIVRLPRPPRSPTPSMETFFIQALTQAGTCRQHQRSLNTGRELAYDGPQSRTQRRGITTSRKQQRWSFKGRGPFSRFKKFARSELKALVDYYGFEAEEGAGDEMVEDSGLLIWNVGDDHQPWTLKEKGYEEYISALKKLLDDPLTPHDAIFETYKKLPAPGVAYLRLKTIRKLLNHLAVIERPTQLAMQRYLSILDDMKDAHIHVTVSEWTSAIHLAGNFMGKVTGAELQSALFIWRDMEKRAGIQGGAVTLHVLFDVAVKAGNYALADVFLKEMQARDLKFHRHFRISLMYYYGVMQNGVAVRKAFHNLVDAGDIVDTVVLNALISALMRAKEPSGAEHVFEKMKQWHAQSAHDRMPHPESWREHRKLGLELTYEAQKLVEKGDKKALNELQSKAPIGPDSRTYGLIIRHHAATAGNIDRVMELLREMRHKNLPLEGTIFIVIMYGFSSFGGLRYSSWTRSKLEGVWTQYLEHARAQAERTWLSPMAICVALKAFHKCADEERTLRAWEEAHGLWQPQQEEVEQVLKVLRKLMPRLFTARLPT
ncbi:hypothetical protein M011DRAFT_472181 [Sporormia fimetaria CBS 119925]|uniref:Pentatricopeptide repeat protein-like protein n=1 Tax=Sporormia fimetaria CBS 119925 TaxID=1340428 RepID=A0A6A6UW16_9PLEO|nr:hypothetical protein M011DRAFT_472181 [Sporormia fimetaria CBS 119925]